MMDFNIIEYFSDLGLEKSLCQKTWTEVSSVEVAEIINFCDIVLSDDYLVRKSNRLLSALFLVDITKNAYIKKSLIQSPVSEILIQKYTDRISIRNEASELFRSISVSDLSYTEVDIIIKQLVANSRANRSHQLFDFLETEASFEQLKQYTWAENLCDLNFVNILAYLMQNFDGSPRAEIAKNYFDEIGFGVGGVAHTELRESLMEAVGLPGISSGWKLDSYLTEEYEHFNAYCAYGRAKKFHIRLIGMLYATEYSVPNQQTCVLNGWMRVGVPFNKLEYITEHIVGDEGHADSWVNGVVWPLVSSSNELKKEILIGVCQHIEKLTSFYDSLYQGFRE